MIPFFKIKKFTLFCRLYIKEMSNPTKIENQIEESITKKISEMFMMIVRFIKGLKSLNMIPNEVKVIPDLIKKTKWWAKNRIIG